MDISTNSTFLTWYQKINLDEHKRMIKTQKNYHHLGYYSVVYTETKNNNPITHNESTGAFTVFAYTKKPEIVDVNFEEFTIGELSKRLFNQTKPTLIKLNPDSTLEDQINSCEEIIFCPREDKMSKQLTITSLDQTLPLMAIDQAKVESLNFEAIYAFFRDTDLPASREERTHHILKMIEFIQFSLKRTPIKFGSSSVMCIFLDFEDPIEENQFIQEYRLLDSYSNVIFVNSELEIINSYRQKIEYDGEKMETILLPIINWQKSNNLVRQELL